MHQARRGNRGAALKPCTSARSTPELAYYFRIDHGSRLLAVFSPKCASSTIRNWLSELDRLHGNSTGDEPGRPYFTRPWRLEGHEAYYRVFFVRDPLRRLVSFYAHWAVRSPGYWDFADQRRRFGLGRRSFRQFLYVLDHLHRNGLEFQHHLEPQTEWIRDMAFDRVILVENLHDGLSELSRQFGLAYTPPRRTRTDYRPRLAEPVADRPPSWLRQHGVPEPRWFYDPELLDIGQRIYAEDLAYYRGHGGKTLDL